MVLCAGFGTRVRPLTNERPKPLLPFGDRTLLEHVVDALEPDLLPVVVNAHYLSELFVAFSQRYPAIAHVTVEATIRGTAGGVAGARSFLGPAPVLVTNGDVLARVDARALLARTPLDSVCLAVAPQATGAGTVGLGEHGEVVRLRGERFGIEVASGDYVGTMALGSAALATLPEAGCLIGDVTLPLLRRGVRVPTLAVAGRWFTPGDSIADYLDEHDAWLRERAVALGADEGVSPPSYVAPGARIEAAVEVVASVIGAGAVVTGSGQVVRVVAWPGARVVGPLTDAVVTTAGQVVRRPST
jgi:mannose-1-phosphate guanylyltransferase